jgi:hypothetical protein
MRHYPTILKWNNPVVPVPMVVFDRKEIGTVRKVGFDSPPWLQTGAIESSFDFSGKMLELISDISQNCPEFFNLDPNKILVTITRARNFRLHGLQARVTPMRFEGGNLQCKRGNRNYEVQQYYVDGREIYYLVTFCLPRFQDQTLENKLVTVFHELYHISPEFNGDLRRHQGRCAWHTHSKKSYDVQMLHMAREYVATTRKPYLHDFLRVDFAQLIHKHGGINGSVVPLPRLVPTARPAKVS